MNLKRSVISSVLLGFVGVTLGIAVSKLISIESVRGNMAAWALIAFGLIYFVWGVRNAIRNKPHTHIHSHADSHKHAHTHVHTEEHTHVHKEGKSMTPWVLFVIFVLGPCEPLIPLLMYPAAKESTMGMILVTGVFSAVTIATMLGVVLVSTMGLNFLPLKKMERYTHALAGATISHSGMAIQFLGL
ncbi:MAG: sulfite exporter TauE/SafE family protein [Nitrospira sp.]|nr:sulfite exporter TauE/SafE family protein [Nitrospira sp.]